MATEDRRYSPKSRPTHARRPKCPEKNLDFIALSGCARQLRVGSRQSPNLSRASRSAKVTASPTGEVRHGTRGSKPDVRLLGGHFVFDSPDAGLLVSLLPTLMHVRGVERLSTLVRLVGDESIARRSGCDLVLTRLVEVLLIEALRSSQRDDTPPGLLRGLADPRIATAMQQMHGQIARSWTMAQLAKKAGLSRSAFFDRFTRTVGIPPMKYLLAWRMAVAKDLLRGEEVGIAEVADRVGYGSASTFSTAFSRHVGEASGWYARAGVSGSWR